LLAARPAQALAGEFDAMGVVNEAVQDSVAVIPIPMDRNRPMGMASAHSPSLDGRSLRTPYGAPALMRGIAHRDESRSVGLSISGVSDVQDEISGQASAMIGSYWGAIGAAE
jgi:hypothetical protein